MNYWHIARKNIGVYTRAEQERLRRGRVLICGLGGVGSYQAELLARLGVGALTCVDAGTFHVSNLNRQALSSVRSVGKRKACFVAARLREINPLVAVRAVPHRITTANAERLVAGHDMVLEAVDNTRTKIVIHEAAKAAGIPSVAVLGGPRHRGFVSVLLPCGPDYQTVLGIHDKERLAQDTHFCNNELQLKSLRVKSALRDGAPFEWASRFLAGKAPWATDVLRAHMIALLAVNEAVSYLTCGEVSAPAPRAIIINLSRRNMVEVQRPPDGQHWDYGGL